LTISSVDVIFVISNIVTRYYQHLEVNNLAREQFQTLSEPMYYILLSLIDKCCGVDIMKRAEELSQGRIAVGPGTLYTLLARFQEAGIINEAEISGRKRTYIISDYGKELLKVEYNRLHLMLNDGEVIMGGL